MANLPYVNANSDKVLGILKMYSRMGAYPLDATSVFNSLADVEAYISEAGSYAYAGQVIAVANGTTASTNGGKYYTLYVIRSDKTLQEIGKNLVFASTTDATAYATANAAAVRPGEVFTVKNGTKYDLYTFNADASLRKLSFDASTDLPEMAWDSITGKPTNTVSDIDSAVTFVNTNLGENTAQDHLTYGGNDVALTSDLTWDNIDNKPETYAPSAHTHTKDDITSVNASAITGTISIDNLPQGALERLVVVADDDARFALTSENVQLGDVIKVTATEKMYYVKDEAKLDEEAGYEVFVAGAVAWAGISNKPTTISGYGITDAVNSSDVVTTATANKLLKLDASGKLPASITGDADTVDGKHASDFAEASHTHTTSEITGLDTELTNIKNGSSITALDGSVITTGTISVDRLPTEALMQTHTAANLAAAKSLSADAVNNGDIVVVTGGDMYIITDKNNLSDGSGLTKFTGDATSVEWTNVGSTPTTIEGYGITDAVNSSEIVTTAEANKILKLNADSKLPASITGDADTVDGKHASDFAEASHTHTEDDITGNISWSKLSDTPTTISGYGITDAVNSSDVVTAAAANKILKLNADSKLPASITGDADTVDGKHASDFAEASHTHAISEVTNLETELANIKDGSAITALDSSVLTGTISIDRLPAGALERCVVVANDDARFALTTDDVQLGDTVKVTATNKMYFVKDAAKLSEEAGYEVYTAGSATSVPWSGVTSTPTTVSGYGITDTYTKTEAEGKFVDLTDVTTTAEASKILKLDADGKLPADITGEAGSVAWANVTDKPTSAVADIDTAVTNTHTHSNKTVIDKFAASSTDGHVEYDGNTVANMSDVTNMIVVSATQPTNQPVGGIWFQEITE